MALDFCEGRCHLAWDQKKITTGFGIYTSLFSRGIWYDSGQAKWRLLSSSVDGLVAEGFWPWIPVSQSWKISRRGENAFEFEIGMRLLRKTTLAIQETVLMLDQAYHHWTLDHKEIRPFPETATGNDFFRFCSWAHIADGKTGLLSISEGLPAVLFKPDLLKDQQVIVESTSHISAMPARLIHCLLSHRNQGGYLEAGDYDFFKGVITLDGEAR